MEITVQENIVTEGLSLHLDARSGFGTDLSGNSNIPSLSGNVYDGESYQLTTNSINTLSGTNLNLTGGQFTLESWVYYGGNSLDGGSYGQIFTQDTGSALGGQGWQWRVSNSNKQIEFIYWTSSSRSSAVGFSYSTPLVAGNWYHLVVSYDGTNIKGYINGSLDVTHTPSSELYGSTAAIGIGRFSSLQYRDILNGKIAVIRGYKNYYLSDEQIQSNYINQKGRFFEQDTFTIKIEDTMPTDGLILRLDAANKNSYPGSGTTWYDLSGNGYDATLVNGPTYSNDNGGSIVFDGDNDYATTPITTTYQNFTLNCWFYNTSSSNFYRNLISKISYYATALTDFPVSLTLNDSGTEITIKIASGTSYSITDPSTGSRLSASLDSLNTWYYVSATYDKQNLKLYLNGQLVASTPNTISLPNNTLRSWAIGRASFEVSGGVGETQYNGNISQVSIYNRALTSEEIENIYNQRYSSGNGLSIFNLNI